MRLSLRAVDPEDVDVLRATQARAGHVDGAVVGVTRVVAGGDALELRVRVRSSARGAAVAAALTRAVIDDERRRGTPRLVVAGPAPTMLDLTTRAVLFDLDDTLLDHAGAAAAAASLLAEREGLGGADPVARWQAATERWYPRYQARRVGLAEHRRARLREFLARPDLADADADRLFAGYQTDYRDRWAAFDDAGPALRRARGAGLRVGVLTNGEVELQTDKLRAVGLLGEVDVVCASSELPAAKPDVRAFTAAAGRLGVPVSSVTMVGDAPATDVAGARAAGAAAVLLDRRGVHRRIVRPGVRRVATLDELEWPTT